MKDICKCGHPLSEHYEPSYECGRALEADLVEGLTNYCRHCEENQTWQEDPKQGIEEKEL